MRNPFRLAILAFIVGLTAFSVAVVWPDAPDRYLPGFIPWPSGTGLKVGDLDREHMRLGLDLKGGTYILLEADTSRLPPGSDPNEALEGAQSIIEDRINRFGVSETEIQREGGNRLAVQLPGIGPEEARELIGKTALLEFREPRLDEAGDIVCQAADGSEFAAPLAQTSLDDQADPPIYRCTGLQGQSGQVIWQPAACQAEVCGDLRNVPLTGRFLRSNAQVVADPRSPTGISVAIEFNRSGSIIFEDVSGRLVGYPLAIFLDQELIGAPIVNQRISGGQSTISGLERGEARRLAIQLNAGALPVPLRTIQVSEVDATLGDDTLRLSVQAGIIGVLAVMAFMVLYYRLPGVLAALALVVYASTVLMIFKLGPIIGPVTITLAGIAAFVLSVGIAVDANILVFERMKEELRGGRNLTAAIEAGFDRAWTSIRDSNVSTLITCVILWWFGDQFNAALVKGFALTLGIGVLISMFSAITVTRTFLRLLVGTPLARNLWLFGAEAVPSRAAVAGVEALPDGTPARVAPSSRGGARPYMLDFVGRRGFYYLLSLAILIPGVVSLLIPPSLKPGIEFTAGTTFTIEFRDKTLDEADVRTALADLGHDEARVQKSGEGTFILRLGELKAIVPPVVGPPPPGEQDVIEDALRDRFGEFTVTNFNSVSEIVSREIGRNAAIAVLVAAVAILLYITFSFRRVDRPWRYGIAAIIATMHDTLFVLGAYSIFGKAFGIEVNTMFITGLLTVIGFSVHDTIVVFDRIRENVARNPGVPFDEVVNASLTETLGRSINTSTTVVFTIIALLLLGGVTIQSFLLVLLIGVIAGTYSSIFIASQILVSWEHDDLGRLLKRIFPTLRRPEVEAEA